jgi:hypothetical protein
MPNTFRVTFPEVEYDVGKNDLLCIIEICNRLANTVTSALSVGKKLSNTTQNSRTSACKHPTKSKPSLNKSSQ